MAGQLAKRNGCRVVGIAGSADKCRYVTDELGFDGCVDHRGTDLGAALEAACPRGIDVYFENVGGDVQRAVYPLLNDFGRMIMCGIIAEYNDVTPRPGPSLAAAVRKRLKIQGFIVSNHAALRPEYLAMAAPLVRSGELKYREDIVEGIDNAPAAFTERVAIITAAASGIGRATADIMAREGATVVAVDIDQARLDETVAALLAAGGRAVAKRANVLDAIQVDTVASAVAQEFGAIDILVNAVGGSTIIPHLGATMDQLSHADWQRLIAFNLDGTFLFCHAVAPIMKRQRRGKIVNLSSIAGRGLSASSSAAYAAAKGGIIAFTRKIAFELGPYGINVNAIAPSRTLTERIRPRWEQQSPEDQAVEIARTPLRRIAEAPDQAKVICFLASRDADFVTGVTINVTGGN